MDGTGNGIRVTAVDKEGRAADLPLEDARAAADRPDQFVWIHVLAKDHPEAIRFLQNQLGFHELAVEDALSAAERPSIQEYEDHAFLTVSVLEGVEPEVKFTEVGVFIRPSAVVTVVREECPLIDDWRARWAKNPAAIGTDPAWVVHTLLDATVDDYFPAVDKLEDKIESLADLVYAGKPLDLGELNRIRQALLEIRKRNSPTRDILNVLIRRDFPFTTKEVVPYFQDVYDHALRVHEGVEMNREALTGLVEANMSVISNNLNDVMKKMTVISTMLMGGALIAGIYGMNFQKMPELGWAYGYPFALLLMALSMATVFLFFRWRKWV